MKMFLAITYITSNRLSSKRGSEGLERATGTITLGTRVWSGLTRLSDRLTVHTIFTRILLIPFRAYPRFNFQGIQEYYTPFWQQDWTLQIFGVYHWLVIHK